MVPDEEINEGMFEEDKVLKKDEKVEAKFITLQALDYKEAPLEMKFYWTFFLYHLFYYNLLGPFLHLLLSLHPKTRILSFNMQIFRPTLLSFMGLIPWFVTFMVVFLYFWNGFKNEIYAIIIYNCVMISILKCAIIAGKYGSFGAEKIEQLYTRKMTIEELHSQHMLEDWAR
jgi:hypothetical protein